MTAPTTLAEAEAQCRELGVDLRVSGRGMTACMDLLAPFCPSGVVADMTEELPRCAGAPPSPAKAAVLLREAEARAGAGAPSSRLPWLWVGGGALAVALVWFAIRKG